MTDAKRDLIAADRQLRCSIAEAQTLLEKLGEQIAGLMDVRKELSRQLQYAADAQSTFNAFTLDANEADWPLDESLARLYLTRHTHVRFRGPWSKAKPDSPADEAWFVRWDTRQKVIVFASKPGGPEFSQGYKTIGGFAQILFHRDGFEIDDRRVIYLEGPHACQ